MTDVYLALDAITATGGLDLPSGTIVGLARSEAALRAAGFAAAAGYRNDRITTIDDGAAGWSADAAPGWFYVHAAAAADRRVQRTVPLTQAATDAARVAEDIARFKVAVNREALDVEAMLAREAFSPHTDSGHAWSADVLHAIAKPHVRLLEQALAAAKAAPSSATIDAYAAQLGVFLATADDPGLLGIYRAADKSVWRPHRDGTAARGYDTATGGIRQINGAPVEFPVSYPDGETVATWDALGAVEAL